jgi:hypothetical protein
LILAVLESFIHFMPADFQNLPSPRENTQPGELEGASSEAEPKTMRDSNEQH